MCCVKIVDLSKTFGLLNLMFITLTEILLVEYDHIRWFKIFNRKETCLYTLEIFIGTLLWGSINEKTCFQGPVATPTFTRITRRLSLSNSRIFSDSQKQGKQIIDSSLENSWCFTGISVNFHP